MGISLKCVLGDLALRLAATAVVALAFSPVVNVREDVQADFVLDALKHAALTRVRPRSPNALNCIRL